MWRSPGFCIGLAVFSFTCPVLDLLTSRDGSVTRFVVLSLLMILLYFLLAFRVFRARRARIKRVIATNVSPGTVLRADFGTHSFTLRSHRGTRYYPYAELKEFTLITPIATFQLRHEPGISYWTPCGLFTEPALKLIEPHVKIRRRNCA